MGVAVVSSCDSAKILEAGEHALDGVAVAVQVGREAVLPASVGLRWNVRSGPLALDLAADGVAVVPPTLGLAASKKRARIMKTRARHGLW